MTGWILGFALAVVGAIMAVCSGGMAVRAANRDHPRTVMVPTGATAADPSGPTPRVVAARRLGLFVAIGGVVSMMFMVFPERAWTYAPTWAAVGAPALTAVAAVLLGLTYADEHRAAEGTGGRRLLLFATAGVMFAVAMVVVAQVAAMR